MQQYVDLGLKIGTAVNAVEAGIYAVWQLLSAGKLKVFKSLGNWLSEFRLYQRDQDGKIVKQDDHLMDAMRYLIMSGRDKMKPVPVAPRIQHEYRYPGENALAWMEA
jgi:hypothetical protein